LNNWYNQHEIVSHYKTKNQKGGLVEQILFSLCEHFYFGISILLDTVSICTCDDGNLLTSINPVCAKLHARAVIQRMAEQMLYIINVIMIFKTENRGLTYYSPVSDIDCL